MESRTRKHVKGYGFLSFARNLSNKFGKQLLDTATKSGTNSSKKIIHKAVEATGEFNSYDDQTVKTKPVEEIIFPSKKEKKYQTN